MGWGNLERTPHLVNWRTICTSKKNDSLGVRSLSKLNKALLSNWNWRFASERDALWRKVIINKFGVGIGDWNSGDIRGGFGTSLW